MYWSMKVAIIPIGNSRGVRLPKAVLDECRFTDAAELTVENGRVLLTPLTPARAHWAAAFDADPPGDLTPDDLDWLDPELTEDED
jgi:antitoxin MazE